MLGHRNEQNFFHSGYVLLSSTQCNDLFGMPQHHGAPMSTAWSCRGKMTMQRMPCDISMEASHQTL